MAKQRSDSQEFGRSVADYFAGLQQKAKALPKESTASGNVPLDSFGQWREADAGSDRVDDRD